MLLYCFSSEKLFVVFLLLDSRSSETSIIELKSATYEFDGVKPVMRISRYVINFWQSIISLLKIFPPNSSSYICQSLREWIKEPIRLPSPIFFFLNTQ